MKKFRKYIILAVSFVVVFGLDMLTKIIFEGKDYSLMKGIIGIKSVHNTGAAFSIFAGHQLGLSIFTSIMVVVAIVFFVKYNHSNNILFEISLAVIISGAIGNLVDRIFLGYVRDFINFEFINFAIFNIADTGLTLGIICLVVYMIFFDENFKEDKVVEDGKPK